MLSAALFLFGLLTTSNALTCDCGFIDPQDSSQSVWTTYFETNFSASTQLNLQYRNLQNNLTKNGFLNRLFVPQNVKLDDEGVKLTVSAWQQGQTDVLGAELETNQTDLWYGSYHITARMTPVAGTVNAFFVFQSDSNEVDIEYVSSNDPEDPLRFSVKPQDYDANGNPLPDTLVTFPPPAGVNVTDSFHTYSFLWNSQSVTFFFDGNQSGDPLTKNVPQLSGNLAISHWSDGNPKYSGGPPTVDSVLTVQRVWAFYNSTYANSTGMQCVNSKAPCNYGEMVVPTLPTSNSNSSGGGNGGKSNKPNSTRLDRHIAWTELVLFCLGAFVYTIL